MADKRVLTVQDLTVKFDTSERSVTAVRGLGFHVLAGEVLAIVGESGSGKSVTSLALMRLVEHGGGHIAGGRIEFTRRDGRVEDLVNTSDAVMRTIRGSELSMIFQEPMTSLNPVFPVGAQISEAVRLHQGFTQAAAQAEALRMLELVRIPEAKQVLGRYPHQLSGGMRQRVMIAMALSCKPGLLIADEPTTALDVTIQAQILQLIRQLQEELGMAVIFITHDMGVVAEVADRVLVMYRGEAVEEGESDTIFHHPGHGYTRALLSAVPVLGSMSGTDAPAPFPLFGIVDSEAESMGDVAKAVREELGQELAAEKPRQVMAAELAAELADAAEQALEHPETASADMAFAVGAAFEASQAASSPSEQGNEPVLAVENLITRFDVEASFFGKVRRRVHAVEQVSFHLYPGETLGLVGESGCGKSTIGRSLIGLETPRSGTIVFGGEELSHLAYGKLQGLRRHIQYIFQDPYASLDPRLTVGFSIMEPLLIHKVCSQAEAAERVKGLLEKVGLDPAFAVRYPHEFSGGQRQRVCIARALALNPKIIIADESVSALDVSVRAQIVNLLLELQREYGLAFIFISHDMAVILPDHVGMALAVSGISFPTFALGLLLMEVFSVSLGWLPTVGAETWRHYILPSITLGAGVAAVMARFTRASFVEILQEDYIRTAWAKGLGERAVVVKHGLRNALIPVITMMGLQFGFLLGGSIIVEKVFNWPGLGRLLVDAVEMRDYPVLQAEVLLFSLEFILINLLVDILYAVINPRIRFK